MATIVVWHKEEITLKNKIISLVLLLLLAFNNLGAVTFAKEDFEGEGKVLRRGKKNFRKIILK